MMEKTNLLGTAVTVSLYALYILMFLLRLLGKPEWGRWLASLQFLSVIPLVYLIVKAPQLNRPVLYYVQISLMLFFLILELGVDYILQVDFRQNQGMVIAYVTLFFASTGGLLGVAIQEEGRFINAVVICLFLVMAGLAFVQRVVTGL